MILELEDEKVVITKEGETLPEIKEVKKKKNWKDIVTYVFWVYKKDNIYQNQLISKKKISTCRIYLPDYKPEDFEEDIVVKRLITAYVNLQCTITEYLLEKCKEDIDRYLNHLTTVPYTIKGKIKRQVGEHQVEEIVDIENFDEKNKAIKMAESLIDTYEKLKLKIVQEGPKAKKGGNRLFDQT